MSQPPKKRDENAKAKRWQVPVRLEHVTPEDYPPEWRRQQQPDGAEKHGKRKP